MRQKVYLIRDNTGMLGRKGEYKDAPFIPFCITAEQSGNENFARKRCLGGEVVSTAVYFLSMDSLSLVSFRKTELCLTAQFLIKLQSKMK